MTHHIDDLAKSLAEKPIPRRHAFRLFGAALAGALLGPLGLRTASAGPSDPCRDFCSQCPKSQSNRCLADCRTCSQAGGHLCGTCNAYGCCAAWQDCCGTYCADTDSDIHNCGACGQACEDPGLTGYAVCVSGTCQYYFCGPQTDYMFDSSNCGRCGNVCPAGTSCAFGFCEGGGGGGG